MPTPRSTVRPRLSIALSAVVSALTAASCVVSTPPQRGYQGNPGGPPGYAPGGGRGAGQAGRGSEAEVFRPRSFRQPSRALLRLPGSKGSQLVSYDVVDGMAVMEGDILLGPVSELMTRYGPLAPRTQGAFHAVVTSDTSHLWPGGEIPYVIHPSVSGETLSSIQWAIGEVNSTGLRVRPWTPADRDHVVFKDNGDGCTSFVGRIGGAQTISVSGCGRGSVVHELLHASGFYHEQSRSDRDDFVTIMWNEVEPSYRSNFEMRPGVSQDSGSYDYGSVMHYSSRAFSRTGNPTIVPRNPSAVIGQRDGLSQSDRAAIAALYGGGSTFPSTPTTPTNPTVPPTNPAPGGSFAGNYTSSQGDVACNQSGSQVSCRFPAGTLTCAASGNDLPCVWSGGRAMFRRQPSGVLAGTWGDLWSDNNRGAWDLVPAGGGAPPTAPGPAPAPANPWWPFPTTPIGAPGQPAPAWPFPIPTLWPGQ